VSPGEIPPAIRAKTKHHHTEEGKFRLDLEGAHHQGDRVARKERRRKNARRWEKGIVSIARS